MSVVSHLCFYHQGKDPFSPDDGGRYSFRNAGLLSTTQTACWPRIIYWFHVHLVLSTGPTGLHKRRQPFVTRRFFALTPLSHQTLHASTSTRSTRASHKPCVSTLFLGLHAKHPENNRSTVMKMSVSSPGWLSRPTQRYIKSNIISDNEINR